MNLHYVGFKWAAQIRVVVRRFETDAPNSQRALTRGVATPMT
jgi:hypothetical protein